MTDQKKSHSTEMTCNPGNTIFSSPQPLPHLKTIAVLLAVIISIASYSQREQPGIKVLGRSTASSIRLRWAPNTPVLWQLANTYGYTIERVTLTVNNKVQQTPIKTILNATPIKPVPLPQWEKPMDEDDYVAVAAQAIYGQTFQLTNNYSSDIIQVINKTRELESRFSFALFASDVSIKAAQLSGLYYEDETIAAGTRYVYRIYANVPSNIVKADTGYVYLGLQDYLPLPKPRDLQADFDDLRVLLSWNGEIYSSLYSSYWVERSEDGRNFTSITKEPIVNAYPGDKPKTNRMFKLDSLPVNDKTFYYRVKGINAFGETGPPSDTLSGSGKPAFAYSATITHAEALKEGPAEITWSLPDMAVPLVKSFDLLRVDPTTKAYDEVSKSIDKSLRSVKDASPRGSNYYVIRTNDKYGRSTNSFPYLLQTEDSIPPNAPVKLVGKIDTLGIVHIEWDANTESDLLGYSMFRSNFNSNEFIQLPGEIFNRNYYTDTIKLNTLTETIHYKLRAFDKRFNPSEFSAVLTLKKPDKIPPVPPVFSSIKSDSTGVRINWEPSGSEDVEHHLLYRRAQTEQEWTLLKSFSVTDNTKTYLDQEVKHKTEYAYTLLAVDDAGLESIPAAPITITYVSQNPYPKVGPLFYSVNKEKRSINLSWNYTVPRVKKYLVYKSINKGPLKLYKTMEATTKELIDDYGLSENEIEYRVVAGFENGDRTKMNEGIVVRI